MDDSFDDDVFEITNNCKLIVLNSTEAKASSTGYPSYKPPAVAFEDYQEEQQIVHKTILLGDSGVGKTSLLVQFEHGKFEKASFAATVGIGFTNKMVRVDNSNIKLQIWDTAGQERFRSIAHAYYRDAHALLLLYDCTNKQSFDNIRAWLAEIKEYAHDDVVIMLIGNKTDCNEERVVRKEDGMRLAKEYGVAFMETSAKTALNVEAAFMLIARQLRNKENGERDDSDRVVLERDGEHKESNKFSFFDKQNVESYLKNKSDHLSSSCSSCNYG